jgi:pyridinium-3,5-bisthiocarboxylic acid mononucleotide nickel chelatase
VKLAAAHYHLTSASTKTGVIVRQVLYLDPWAGAAGDMLLGALLGLSGPDLDLVGVLHRTVASLDVGATVVVESVVEHGFVATRITVEAPVVHHARRLADLEILVSAADIPPEVRDRSLTAFRRLAAVEAALHGVDVSQVHFHELGAVDTLVDVVGVFALVRALGAARCVHGPVPLGSGRVHTDHGELGVPAPATLALLHGRPVVGGPAQVEVTTPTGALLLTELASTVGAMPAMVVRGVGYGAGHRTLASGPNLLRVVLGSEPDDPPAGSERIEDGLDHVVLLETVVDDASPEILGYLFERLRREGALEVWWSPVFMKKARPAAELSVLCERSDEQRLVGVVFGESGTFGVRRTPAERHVLARSWVTVVVDGAQVRVKVGRRHGEVVTVSPEFDDVAAIAERSGCPLHEVMERALRAARSGAV